MSYALIGASGFVGTTLQRQRRFDELYRSTNIASVAGREFDTVVCAAAPAQKWIANREPERDRENLDALFGHLSSLRCRRFVLVSTVDVFGSPVGVDESTEVVEHGLHAYGLNRRILEKRVADRFADHLIVRLPGLVGPGLRKNVIFDFLNDNNVSAIDSRGVFQFYPMVNLWSDVERSFEAGLRLVHLTAAPLGVAEIAREAFGRDFRNEVLPQAARYDFRSRHAAVYGGAGDYQYSVRESLLAIRAYAQSEPRTPAQGA